jgi:Glycosyltransferase like family 2
VTDVLVAIPAHDEQAEIAGCLEHLAVAVRQAQASPAYGRVRVAVAAHRCHDETFAVARDLLAGLPGRHLVVRDEASTTVGEVRARLVAAGSADLDPSRTWLLSTDADSHVPADWVTGSVAVARHAAAVAVAGMVELRDWDAPAEVLERYRALVAGGLTPDGHTHVYGANLAVRLDAYLRVGGFRAGHGEDQDLVDRLRAAGEHVLSRFSPLVRTSARRPGRAEHGLGALLQRMQEDAVTPPRLRSRVGA